MTADLPSSHKRTGPASRPSALSVPRVAARAFIAAGADVPVHRIGLSAPIADGTVKRQAAFRVAARAASNATEPTVAGSVANAGRGANHPGVIS